MDHILWLSRIFGPFFTIIALWIFFRTEEVIRVWHYAKHNVGVLYIVGMLNLLMGLTILSTYHEWSFHLAVLLPIIAWMMILRGMLIFFATEWFIRFKSQFEPFHKAWAVVPLFFGISLSYIAFFI